MLALRPAVFFAGLAAFVVFSVERFNLPGAARKLDLVSQADNIGDPARSHLAGRLAPGARIGCLNANPDWPDECDYFYYSLLPYYVRDSAKQPAPDAYLLFAANPRAPRAPREQASAIPDYSIELALPQAVFLLKRSAP